MANAAKKKAEPVEEVKPVKVAPILEGRFKPAEQVYNNWQVMVPVSVSPDDVMDQAYWTNIGHLMTPGDRLWVMPDDMSWGLSLFVRGAGRHWASVAKLEFYDIGGAKSRSELPDRYTVKYGGPHYKWQVLRGKDVLKSNMETEDIAIQFVKAHEAKL